MKGVYIYPHGSGDKWIAKWLLRITLLLFIRGNSASAAAPTKRLTLRRKLVAARVTVKKKKRGSRNLTVGMIMMRSRWLKAVGG